MVLNIFGRGRQRNDRMGADHFYGPRLRRRNNSHGQHISWSYPVETQPLTPDGSAQIPVEPFVPLYSFSQYTHRNSAKAEPRHRFMQPRHGILRPTPQPPQHQFLASPTSDFRGRTCELDIVNLSVCVHHGLLQLRQNHLVIGIKRHLSVDEPPRRSQVGRIVASGAITR